MRRASFACRRSWRSPCIIAFGLLLIASPVASIWPFPPKRFTKNSLMEAGSMGLDDGGRIVAFGDFNGDQFLDVLTLDPDQQTLTAYLWNHESFIFQNVSSIRHPMPIYNVIPGDFTHDGKLDVLVMSASSVRGRLDMDLYRGLHNGFFESTTISIPSSTLSEPITVDINGDMKIDLLGAPSPRSSPTSTLQVWKNAWNSTQSAPVLFELVNPPFNGVQCTLANPHSNAVIDLNGDCLAASDIFLVCDDGSGRKSYQIWVNNKDTGFSLAQQGALPSGTQAISFADIDRDGTIDMVFPTCSSVSSAGVGSECVINIAYNKQLPLCSSATAPSIDKSGRRICRSPEELCTADPNFRFDLTAQSNNKAFVHIPLSSLLSSSAGSLLVLDTTFTPPIPVPIKLGDANLDGFPDLLFIVDSNGSRTPKLVFSVPCAKDVAGCGANGEGKRGWSLLTKGADSLEAVKDARGAAFLDLAEDGTLDIVVQRTGTQDQGTVSFIQNNFYYDAFFLKAIVLNGACGNGWCPSSNGSSYLPFGVSYSGASYKYTVLDTSGQRSAAQVGQLPQTSYHSLLTPYSFFGLGRTNNYIENLFVGSTKHTDQHFINMEGVIPNSRVVIHPPPDSDSGGWRRELFLRPGEWIPWVTLTVVVATAVLAGIVFVLHLNEKREDELERRRASHHINFDAL
ncbi:integrin alpha N-terminal domain-containing protein [Leucogyrophana mollusca]|uniref:Integrin alpha N-terminal domain-containing protein n=1 Tax=Leucogyrophana mollusca TaxID=85980 RepID=A0ACB8BTK4_9AGAM|nr:integrin alpha N-terminal domain-containing protein [Leucogyrophana mollusca]